MRQNRSDYSNAERPVCEINVRGFSDFHREAIVKSDFIPSSPVEQIGLSICQGLVQFDKIETKVGFTYWPILPTSGGRRFVGSITRIRWKNNPYLLHQFLIGAMP